MLPITGKVGGPGILDQWTNAFQVKNNAVARAGGDPSPSGKLRPLLPTDKKMYRRQLTARTMLVGRMKKAMIVAA